MKKDKFLFKIYKNQFGVQKREILNVKHNCPKWVRSPLHVYFCIHVKCTKSTCFCSENTVKTHENTSKTVHFMYKVWYMYIFVYMWNVPKVHVSAVKTQWKRMKTLAKQCFSCIKYGTCVFLYTWEMYQKYMFLQWKNSENVWEH